MSKAITSWMSIIESQALSNANVTVQHGGFLLISIRLTQVFSLCQGTRSDQAATRHVSAGLRNGEMSCTIDNIHILLTGMLKQIPVF